MWFRKLLKISQNEISMANKTENLPSHQIHYSFFSRRCFLCDRGKFTVWYGTNRRPIDPTNPSMGYGPERDTKEVHYGAVKIFIPASHKIGSTGSSWWRRLLRHCAFLIAMLPNIDFAGGHLNHGLGDDRGRSRLHLPCLAVRQRYQNLRLCSRRRALSGGDHRFDLFHRRAGADKRCHFRQNRRRRQRQFLEFEGGGRDRTVNAATSGPVDTPRP